MEVTFTRDDSGLWLAALALPGEVLMARGITRMEALMLLQARLDEWFLVLVKRAVGEVLA